MERKNIVLTVLFFALAFAVYKDAGFFFEYPVLDFLTDFPEPVIRIFNGFTVMGNPASYFVLWIPVAVLLFFYDKRLLLFMAAAILLPTGLQTGIKEIVQRIRPQDFKLIEQGGFSFPSGHATVGICTYLTAGRLMFRGLHRYLVQSFGIVIGISRLFVGVHWPTDVIAGFILGYIIYREIVRRYEKGDAELQVRV